LSPYLNTNGDATALAALYTEDAVLLTNKGPILRVSRNKHSKGKEAGHQNDLFW
jgi:ketosteroid isomerase-like protein